MILMNLLQGRIGPMDSVREGESGINEESSVDVYTLSCVK